MKEKFYWIGASVVLLTGIGMTVYFGIRPRPVQKITLSEFQSPTVVANSILLRLREEIQQAPILLLGYDPNQPVQLDVWKEFIARSQEGGMKFDHVVVDQNLKIQNEFPGSEQTDTQEGLDQIIPILQGLQSKGQRVALIVPVVYSSQLIVGNLASQLKKRGQLKVTSITLTDFPRNRIAEKTMQYPCSVDEVDDTGLGRLGCMIALESRANYRRHLTHGALVGLLDQVGLTDYLFLLTKEP
jgi:hypothetical protein